MSSEQIEDTMTMLCDMGINVVDSEEVEKGEGAGEEVTGETGAGAGAPGETAIETRPEPSRKSGD